MWGKRDLPTPLVEYKLTRSVWKTVWRFLKQPKIELPYDPTISLFLIYLEKAINSKNIGIPIFITALFTTAKTRKQPKSPLTDEWIKMWSIYTMEYYSVIKKNEVTGFPGGSVVKNPPVNAGDMGSIPGPRGSHMPWSS